MAVIFVLRCDIVSVSEVTDQVPLRNFFLPELGQAGRDHEAGSWSRFSTRWIGDLRARWAWSGKSNRGEVAIIAACVGIKRERRALSRHVEIFSCARADIAYFARRGTAAEQ
jgi:hypothetical protein